jgi:hypothetical protein
VSKSNIKDIHPGVLQDIMKQRMQALEKQKPQDEGNMLALHEELLRMRLLRGRQRPIELNHQFNKNKEWAKKIKQNVIEMKVKLNFEIRID